MAKIEIPIQVTIPVEDLVEYIKKNETLVEVKHGKWLNVMNEYLWYGKCSICGEDWNIDAYYARNMNYCPNCGAKMDGEEKKDGQIE